MSNEIDRRKFMRSSAAAGAGLMLANNALGQTGGKKDDICDHCGVGRNRRIICRFVVIDNKILPIF